MTAPRLTRTTPAPRVGQVHLGPGAFFRAFNAGYTEDAIAANGGDWGIIAVSLRSTTARDQMAPQGGVFTSVTLDHDVTPRLIGSVAEVLVAPEDPEAVIDAIADPAVRIVSLTITEKGYEFDPKTGGVDLGNPEIAHDLVDPNAPRSAIGFLVAGLARRRQTGAPPLTVLSCDNLPSNGVRTRAVTLDFARRLAPDIAEWIEAKIPFPSTMVDRITPATTDADVARLAETSGFFDPACVLHEAFRQWVIEDDFAAGRPAWDAAGAQFVQSVEAHEIMKLRCLNGTHSTLAYLGYLAGYETIADTVANPDFAQLCEGLWADEIAPTVSQPEGEDLTAYCAALLVRYQNPAIRHRTWQIAMDGSQKLPQRILATIADTLAAGRVPHGLCLAVAAWMRYVGGVDESGQPIDVRDPLAERLRAASHSAPDAAGKVAALLAIRDVFTAELAENEMFREAVTRAYAGLVRDGARASVRAFVQAQ